MEPDKYIEICYMYLKQGKWKTKTDHIKEEQLPEYRSKFTILHQKEISA